MNNTKYRGISVKVLSKTSLFVLSLFFVLLCSNTHANRGPSLAQINYRDAFNQSDIHRQYEQLLRNWDCDINVFDQVQTSTLPQKKIDGTNLIKLEKNYQKTCLKRLFAARRWAITKSARENLTLICLLACATVTVKHLLGKDSFGGSISVFSGLFNSVYLLQDVIHAGYNLAFPEAHPLNILEKCFAKNQCFIPRTLWPAIIEKFMIARQNQFEQRTSMDFLEFALGLTVYKPKSTLQPSHDSAQRVILELHKRIDQFFSDYQQETTQECCQLIKLNVSKFVLNLLGNNDNPPRYIYFHGPAGIGKTYFVLQLSEWIEELMPGSVRFESMIITSPDELEGNRGRPGAMLRVLRNQLIADKRGSVVFIDEATWLNESNMVSSAKRVFNGDQSTLSTDYFGGGIDGAGINLAIPPMLIFVASNEEIKEPALKSRFDVIKYPLPTQKALAEHAHAVATKSTILNNAHIPRKAKIENWIASDNIASFRHAQAGIEQFVLSQ